MINQDTHEQTSPLAHPGKRYQGQFIDLLISILLYVVGLYIVKLLKFESDGATIAAAIIPFVYFVLADALPNGQSVGKMILGLSVVSRSSGEPCTILQSIARNILSPFLGIIDSILILGKKRQRLGDMMAGTIVIDLRK